MIAMNDFKSEPEALTEAMQEAVRRVFQSGWYVLGHEVSRFEERWAAVCGVNHAVGVGNGMDAIEISLRTLCIGPGDEVVTTSMTAFATMLAILRAGATPVLADIDPETALLSLDSVARCVTPKTKAVILVHLYGQVRDMADWLDFCTRHQLALIEDCAQAHLAEWEGKVAGAMGTIGAYSFYPTKNLGAIGDAGALVTNNAELANHAMRLRNYGQSKRYHHPELGMNSRLDEIQAAILSERLAWLEAFTERRRDIADAYRQGIANPRIQLLAPPVQRSNHVYHLFVVSCSERDRLAEALQKKGIATHSHYPIPMHRQEPCSGVRIDPVGLPHADSHADHCLSIPCHPQLDDHAVNKVVDAINAFA